MKQKTSNKPKLAGRDICTGCGACVAACPVRAIRLETCDEGFSYPSAGGNCRMCGLCTSACPVLTSSFISFHSPPDEAYAAWCKSDNDRIGSSSGGFFRVLVHYVLEKGGVVFGAAFDGDFSLKHMRGESDLDCAKFYGSKYLQSETAAAFSEVKNILNNGRWVLYSGTPCQVAGLYTYLGGDKERLLTCDLVCNGVPSPAVFHKYLSFLERHNNAKAIDVRFKDKTNGWHNAHFSVRFDNGTQFLKAINDTEYGRGFGSRLFLRRACASCRYAQTKRIADFTLGDFWGIGKETPFPYETEKGVSLVLYNSKKAKEIPLEPTFIQTKRTLSEAVAGNPRLSAPLVHNPKRDEFFKAFTALPFDVVMNTHMAMPGLLYRVLAKMIPDKLKSFLRLVSGRFIKK